MLNHSSIDQCWLVTVGIYIYIIYIYTGGLEIRGQKGPFTLCTQLTLRGTVTID